MATSITLSDLANKIDLLASVIMTNKPILCIEEAAIYTGLSQSYLYKLTSQQAIPHSKPRGKMIYFNRAELDEWLLQNQVKTTKEIDSEAANHLAKV